MPHSSSSALSPSFHSGAIDPNVSASLAHNSASSTQSSIASFTRTVAQSPQISPSSAPTRKRTLSAALDEEDAPKNNKNRRWSKAEEEHIVAWWTDPDNYIKFKNPQGFEPGLTKTKIQQGLANEMNDRFDSMIDYKQVKNKMDSMDKQFKAARKMIGITGNGDQPGRGQMLRDKVIAKCPFYYDVERVWATDIRNDPIEPMEPAMNPLTAAMVPLHDEDENESVTTGHTRNEDDYGSDDDTLGDSESVILVGDARKTSKAKRSKTDDFLDRLKDMSAPATASWKLQEETKRQLAAEETVREKASLAVREREIELKEREIELDRKDARDRERTKRLRDRQEHEMAMAKAKEATRRRELRVREAEINLRMKELEMARGRSKSKRVTASDGQKNAEAKSSDTLEGTVHSPPSSQSSSSPLSSSTASTVPSEESDSSEEYRVEGH